MSEREVLLVFRTVLVPLVRAGLSSQLPRAECSFSSVRLQSILRLIWVWNHCGKERWVNAFVPGAHSLESMWLVLVCLAENTNLDLIKITRAIRTYWWRHEVIPRLI